MIVSLDLSSAFIVSSLKKNRNEDEAGMKTSKMFDYCYLKTAAGCSVKIYTKRKSFLPRI